MRYLLYRSLSSAIIIISASGNLCHSSLVKAYDRWNSNCDTSLHCTIREYCILHLWFTLPTWPQTDLPLPRPPDLPLTLRPWYLPPQPWNILPLLPPWVPDSFILLIFLLLLDDNSGGNFGLTWLRNAESAFSYVIVTGVLDNSKLTDALVAWRKSAKIFLSNIRNLMSFEWMQS